MQVWLLRLLLALAMLAALLGSHRPVVLSSVAPSAQAASPTTVRVFTRRTAMAEGPVATSPEERVDPRLDSALHRVLEPCDLALYRAACAAYAAELAAYGLIVAEPTAWTAFGLARLVGAVERLADALGGCGERARRLARFSAALGTATTAGRILVVWQAAPQARDGNPVRGGYAAGRLYFNPNTYYLDTDTPEEARRRSPAATWWPYIHELAHLWDERSAPVAEARHSAALRRWVAAQGEADLADEYPSSYAVIGGPAEAFAESVAATVTGDAAGRDYYGGPRDRFVRALLGIAGGCQ